MLIGSASRTCRARDPHPDEAGKRRRVHVVRRRMQVREGLLARAVNPLVAKREDGFMELGLVAPVHPEPLQAHVPHRLAEGSKAPDVPEKLRNSQQQSQPVAR